MKTRPKEPGHGRLSDLIVWGTFIAPGIILNKDGSLQTKIVLWQEGHLLRRVTGDDQEKRASPVSQRRLLFAAREAHFNEVDSK